MLALLWLVGAQRLVQMVQSLSLIVRLLLVPLLSPVLPLLLLLRFQVPVQLLLLLQLPVLSLLLLQLL